MCKIAIVSTFPVRSGDKSTVACSRKQQHPLNHIHWMYIVQPLRSPRATRYIYVLTHLGYCQSFFANLSLKKWSMRRWSGDGAATLRLIAVEHMPEAVSRAAKPFILTLDSVGGICYLAAVLMPLLLRLPSNISCKYIVCFPTPSPKHTAVWHRPASEQIFHQGMYQRLSFCVVSHGSSVQWHCLSGSSASAVTGNPCRSRFLQCHSPPS